VRSASGIKAATVTPEGKDDVGSPNRSSARASTARSSSAPGRRIPGVTPFGGVHHPISVVRMAVEDAYGAEQWREGDGDDESPPHREDHALDVPRSPSTRSAPPSDGRQGLRRPEVDGLARVRGDAQGGDGRGRRAPPERPYQPVLIDATYAGLISGAADVPLVIPR
jgi:hypothetical protein